MVPKTWPELAPQPLPAGQRVYFASDFHLGTPNATSSRERERRVVRWLDVAARDAAAIYLLGDVFDFWFEYKRVVPKGFSRLQGKLAELADGGLPITLFTGNHDLWMFDYFPQEMGIPVLREAVSQRIGSQLFHFGHGDGLGPGDLAYKRLLKPVFSSRLTQWFFSRLHPDLGIHLATRWSHQSRLNNGAADERYFGEDEWLLQYCRAVEARRHHDYYVFGHRHLPLDVAVAPGSRYINLGEWVNFCTYGVYDGTTMQLREFEK